MRSPLLPDTEALVRLTVGCLLERRNARDISGWVSYTLGFSRYTDTV